MDSGCELNVASSKSNRDPPKKLQTTPSVACELSIKSSTLPMLEILCDHGKVYGTTESS